MRTGKSIIEIHRYISLMEIRRASLITKVLRCCSPEICGDTEIKLKDNMMRLFEILNQRMK